jgi:hypothetical protein
MAPVLFDGPASAVERNLFEQLEGPYAGTVRRTAVPVDGAGTAVVDWTTRHPLLIAVLRRDLGEETVLVEVTLDPGGPDEQVLPQVEFAPWTEIGGSAPVHAFPGSQEPPFSVAIDPALADLVEFAVVEGNLGRLLYLAAHEKVRLRRALREVHAYRTLAHARRDALDRAGADVGVARFDDELVYESSTGNVYARRLPAPTVEADADYARRLGIYRRFLLPTPGAIDRLLDALFDDLPDGVRPKVQEADDQFAVAVHLMAVGPVTHRDNFLALLHRDRLILPAASAPNDGVHHARRLPQRRIQAIDDLRERLRRSFAFAVGHGIASPLAHALDRAGRVCRALGFFTAWTVQRAQDASAGSRYQLGLGIDLAPPTAAQATDIRNRILDPDRAPSTDATAEALIAAALAAGVQEDPELAWLWRQCGVQTVHRVNSGTIYLSHLPTGGLTITGPANAAPGAQQALQAHFHAPGDPGTNALLLSGMTESVQAWADAGESPWTSLSDAAARTRWATVPVRPSSQPVHQAFAAAGLPSVVDPASVVSALNNLPDELLETIELDAALSAGLMAGQPAAAEKLSRMVATLREHRVAAALPLADSGNKVLLVVSVIGLPLAGLNLAERRATGFRWYLVRLGGADGEIKAVGSHTRLIPRAAGLLAVVALSYVRTGLTDPYEFRVELPDEAVLTLAQYERLMNALTRVYPIGVEVNTYAIRRNHVDLDGDGTAEPLRPAVSRTFRTYQRRQQRGVYDPSPEESNG